MNPKNLPIFELELELTREFHSQRRVIIQAPTGSGKSTQVPQMLLDHGLLGEGQAVILQPRRLAARLLAARVASERRGHLGEEVGYQIRFDDVTSPRTRIRFVTEGILLRQMLSDSRLQGISAVIFDEFHERHLYSDITLARALQIQESTRPDLKIGVMSATLAAEPLQRYLQPCAALHSKGRMHPVAIEYLTRKAGEPGRNADRRYAADEWPVWEIAAREFERLVKAGHEGDVLIFMPGAHEIHRTLQAIRASAASKDCVMLPLHGELPAAEQDAAVARYDRRKVIVSTNVAETSLTIDGVRLVIDSGLARMAGHDPWRGINTLLIEKISRASADQRAGRAGRTAPGHCLRLWTEHEHAARPAQETPEVRRLELSEIVLTLKASGIDDVKAFRWFEHPEARSLERAERLLKDLGALDGATGGITGMGRRMLPFPVHPRYSRMLLAAHEYHCVRPVALIAALTQGRNIWVRSAGKPMDEERENALGPESDSDFFLLMRAWRYAEQCGYDLQRCRRVGIHASAARQVRPIFEHFLRIARHEGLDFEERPASSEAIQRCLLVGFSDNLAKRCDAGTLRCALEHGRTGLLSRESVAQKSPLFVAGEVREVEGRERELNVLITLATAVKEEWVRDLFPDDFSEKNTLVYDTFLRRVIVLKERFFRDLALESKKSDQPPSAAAAAILAEQVLQGHCALKCWDDSVEQWILRVNCLRRWRPNLGLPEIDREARRFMIEQICEGASSYKEIKERPVASVVRSWLSQPQQALVEQYAPERLTLPNGRKARLVYAAEGPPAISARIQDLYGVEGNLQIARGDVEVVIHILAPNHRPVQVTQNLSTFWREAYPKIKQELQRKYPRHEWR
ncbi:MAG: ATP-dependent helicase HrpB [Verrucomicrobia bacterium]|nr:ATP-dependent helicase HrpB [Verrucomicrobiota bacterium]